MFKQIRTLMGKEISLEGYSVEPTKRTSVECAKASMFD
jgi:hypothetical protein